MKKRGPHAWKDAAGKLQKQASKPQMQAHVETPHEMGEEDSDQNHWWKKEPLMEYSAGICMNASGW